MKIRDIFCFLKLHKKILLVQIEVDNDNFNSAYGKIYAVIEVYMCKYCGRTILHKVINFKIKEQSK